MSLDRFVITPYGAPARRRASALSGEIDAILIQGPNPTAQIAGEEAVRQVLRALHGLHPYQRDDFSIETSKAALVFWEKIQRYLIAAGIVLPAIGLIVGTIVIMNIMLMAVSERTREIGIRKAVGARRQDIERQFLVETVLLSLLGGLIGVAAGWTLAQIVAAVSPLPAKVTLWSVGVALALGAGTGIIFGVYPAARAARLDPIVALRAE